MTQSHNLEVNTEISARGGLTLHHLSRVKVARKKNTKINYIRTNSSQV